MAARVSQFQIARECGIHQATVSRILNLARPGIHAKETVEKVLRAARKLGYLHPELVNPERRDSVRRTLSADAVIRLLVQGGELFSTGTAKVENISLSGILLRSIDTPDRLLPLQPHRIEINLVSSELRRFKAICRPVRLDETDGGLVIGGCFEGLSPEAARTLKNFVTG